ncbi:hypothetical protein ABT354_12300 [Streptomyces sp. NPDC000594]|uniref:hypothetical protein n=1 Tax=Streptomyces sp. NPDC000594 TaxID=3154261 RepID=UPI00331BAABC
MRESIVAATGGRVTDASQGQAAKERNFLDGLNAPAGKPTSRATTNADMDFVLGIFFDGQNYGGPTLTVWGWAACKNDGKWNSQLEDLTDWNNRISSLKTASNCYVELFSEPYFGGARQFFTADAFVINSIMDNGSKSMGFT